MNNDILILFNWKNSKDFYLNEGKPLYKDDTLLVIGAANDTQVYSDEAFFCFLYGKIFSAGITPQMILRNYRKHGIKTLDEYDGRFLLVIYDKNKKSIVLLRDKLSLQHVYYAEIKNKYLISSSLRYLLKMVNLLSKDAIQIDPLGLAYYISFQYLPNPATMFKNVYQLPRDTMLFIKNGEIKKISCKNIVFFNNKDSETRENVPKAIKNLLINSFKKQVNFNESDSLGILLSGGMDTSTNAALLTQEFGIKPYAFTASFSETKYNETEDAKIVAKKFKIKHHILPIKPEMIDDLPKIVQLYDNPLGDKSVFAEYFIFNFARDLGITQMVTGEGGDEIFGFPRSRDGNFDFASLPKEINELSAFYFNLTSVSLEKERHSLLQNLNIKRDVGQEYLASFYRNYPKYNSFEKIYFGQWNTWLIEDVYMKDSQLAKNSNFNLIVPYMDQDIVKYMSHLKVENKYKGLHDKWFLKKMMRGILPLAILEKPKHKFWLPFAEWFKTAKRDYMQETILDSHSLTRRYFDKDLLLRIINEHLSGNYDHSRLLWALLFLDLWFLDIKGNYERI